MNKKLIFILCIVFILLLSLFVYGCENYCQLFYNSPNCGFMDKSITITSFDEVTFSGKGDILPVTFTYTGDIFKMNFELVEGDNSVLVGSMDIPPTSTGEFTQECELCNVLDDGEYYLKLSDANDPSIFNEETIILERPSVVNITFISNGETSGDLPDNITQKACSSFTLPDKGNLLRDNFTFISWRVEFGENTVEHYLPGDTFTVPTYDLTLKANWEYNDLLNVEYRDLVNVPGGTYTQEDIFGNSFEHTLSSFNIGKYEVTYELWYTVHQWATSNGYTFANPGCEGQDGTAGAAPTSSKYEPVTEVNWRDVMVWCNAFSQMGSKTPCYTYNGSVIKDSTNSTACDEADCDWNADGYRLPTEGEWQFAASDRGVTPANCASGATDYYGNTSANSEVAWYSANSGSDTHDVGNKQANGLDIYDMSGNVWEWCWDWFDDYPTSAQEDYCGPTTGSIRVRRGGSWIDDSYYLRVGNRDSYDPYSVYNYLGFRVVAG